jgi:long-subunit fatty acid transport protein
VRVEHDGDFRINNIPPALGGGENHSEFETVITFPTIVTVGYGVQVTDNLRVGTDIEWVQFSTIDDLPLAIKQPSAPPGIPANIRQDFNDCVNIGIAGDWTFAKDWRVLFSYKHYQAAVPSYTYIPTIPDSDLNAGSLGIQYRKGHHRLGLAATWVAYDDRTISDNQLPALNGTYQTTVFLVTGSYGYSF